MIEIGGIMSKQQFVTTLLKGTNCNIVSGVGIKKLSGDRLVKYSMHQGRCSGDYVGVLVEIINKDKGAIDRLVFNFDEHCAAPKSDRNNPHFHVIEHCGWRWYLNIPNSILPLIDAINEYVEFYE